MKINANNNEKISEVTKLVEKRCSARLMSEDAVGTAIESIENRLGELNLPKKEWVGMHFTCSEHLERFPAAYQYYPEGTSFTLERCPSGWFLIQICRRSCEGNSKNRIRFCNEGNYQKFYSF